MKKYVKKIPLPAILSSTFGLGAEVKPTHSSIFSTSQKGVWIPGHDRHLVDRASVAVEERVEGFLLPEYIRVKSESGNERESVKNELMVSSCLSMSVWRMAPSPAQDTI